MIDIIFKSVGFLLVILVTYLLKQAGMFRKEDGQMLSKLMLNVTMPCALLSAGGNLKFSVALGAAFLAAIVCNLVLSLGGAFQARLSGYDKKTQGIFAINSSGFNVGSFALPFVQMFFPGSALAYVCMFDAGNSVMGLGVNNAISASIAATGTKPTVKGVIKKLLSSPPFAVYLIVVAVAAFGISIPDRILAMVSIAGNANAFVAMAMIGLMLEIRLPKQDVRQLFQLLAGRYVMGILLALVIWFLLPLPMEAKKVLILCIATPIVSVAAMFTKEMIGDSDIPAAANSISILVALVVMTLLVILFS